MSFEVINLSDVAKRIGQPFTLRPLARIGHLIVSVFVCQGEIDWHKHVDEDELFLVHEGLIHLETDRGNLSLMAEEMALVPKGVYHRSKSSLRSIVVLVRSILFTERTNGHRHFYTTDADPPLEKIRLAPLVPAGPEPYRLTTLAQVEDFEVRLIAGQGQSEPQTTHADGAFWMVVRGGLRIETGAGEEVEVTTGEMTVVPPEIAYRLVCREPSLLITLAKA